MKIPKLRHHKPSGRAVVTLNGRDFYVGPHRSAQAKVEYDRLIAEWLANGRSLPSPSSGPRSAASPNSS